MPTFHHRTSPATAANPSSQTPGQRGRAQNPPTAPAPLPQDPRTKSTGGTLPAKASPVARTNSRHPSARKNSGATATRKTPPATTTGSSRAAGTPSTLTRGRSARMFSRKLTRPCHQKLLPSKITGASMASRVCRDLRVLRSRRRFPPTSQISLRSSPGVAASSTAPLGRSTALKSWSVGVVAVFPVFSGKNVLFGVFSYYGVATLVSMVVSRTTGWSSGKAYLDISRFVCPIFSVGQIVLNF